LYFNSVEEYVSGEFFRRELPCILSLFETVRPLNPDVLLVDGYVWTGDENQKGLGAHLFYSLQEKYPVIGVAKSAFKNAEKICIPVFRGKSKKPLWISAIGTPTSDAAQKIIQMHGEFRMPTLLKELDELTRK
jgi:deoxyribonuclease V